MSASARAFETCIACGADLPRGARFCPECGVPASSPGGTTLQSELPPEEVGPVPISFQRAEPRWFGVAPPLVLLGLAVVLLVLAIALFAGGHWPYGLILLGLAALLFAAFLELARRRPHSRVTRHATDVRERAGSTWETWRTRAAAAAEARRIQSGLNVLESERRTALLELGEAAHRGDSRAEAEVRARLDELDARESELRERLDEQLAQAGERIRLAKLSVQETMMVKPNEPSQPYPPPDEGNPPTPAPVPEPYPPPDEGTPPTPAPDPGRDDDS
jgi:hypothetical protein